MFLIFIILFYGFDFQIFILQFFSRFFNFIFFGLYFHVDSNFSTFFGFYFQGFFFFGLDFLQIIDFLVDTKIFLSCYHLNYVLEKFSC